MKFLEMDDDMTEPQKHSFVQRWERFRHHGMAFFLVRNIVYITLFMGCVELFDPLFRSDPFAIATWAEWYADLHLSSFFIMTTVTGLGIGLLFWFIWEELYKNFK